MLQCLQAHKRNGFTLTELIVVLVIIGILLAIAVPSLIGWIDRTNVTVCEANRAQLERSFLAAKALAYGTDDEVTLKKVMAGDYDATLGDMEAFRCPSGGTYTVSADGNSVICSVHSEIGTESIGIQIGAAIESGRADVPNVTTVASSVNTSKNELNWLKGHLSKALLNSLSGKTWTVIKTGAAFSAYKVLIYEDSLAGYEGELQHGIETVSVSVYDSATGKVTEGVTAYIRTKTGTDPATGVYGKYEYIDISPY